MSIFVVTDDRGRKTQIMKPTEKAVRLAWRRLQAENAEFGLPPAAIVKLEKITD